MALSTKIEFINHASVLISDQECGLLCDPWYEGDAFHKGWNLIIENDQNDINRVLGETTHIWISHEHPDHFSIGFFKKYGERIKQRQINIIFQKTQDKRVKKFLESNGFLVKELIFNTQVQIAKDFNVCCIKDGFYDSGLLITAHQESILNLNDCEITTKSRADEVFSIVGEVDVLLTQFSYAAWKGGEKNKSWREQAALDKFNTMKLQINVFKPRYVIPFASFVYFSNKKNAYLNDSINTPSNILSELQGMDCEVIIMKPYDQFGGVNDHFSSQEAVQFWVLHYDNIAIAQFHEYEIINITQLKEAFINYRKRILTANNYFLMKCMRILSPIKIFQPVVIFLDDSQQTVCLDIFSNKLTEVNKEPHLIMSSESLLFLFKNTFGFDTLTVNGCFEEKRADGFIISTKTLAIENLNNLGIYFSFKLFFNFKLIKLFMTRLHRVEKKLNQ